MLDGQCAKLEIFLRKMKVICRNGPKYISSDPLYCKASARIRRWTQARPRGPRPFHGPHLQSWSEVWTYLQDRTTTGERSKETPHGETEARTVCRPVVLSNLSGTPVCLSCVLQDIPRAALECCVTTTCVTVCLINSYWPSVAIRRIPRRYLFVEGDLIGGTKRIFAAAVNVFTSSTNHHRKWKNCFLNMSIVQKAQTGQTINKGREGPSINIGPDVGLRWGRGSALGPNKPKVPVQSQARILNSRCEMMNRRSNCIIR